MGTFNGAVLPGSSLNHRETESTVFHGKVDWFNVDEGYGFITPDDGGGNVCVHFTEVHTDRKSSKGYVFLDRGQRVSYEVGPGPTGRPQANNVHPL